VLWPGSPADIPDEPSAFQVAYLASDWTPGAAPLERFVTHGGSGPRVCRNALALVEPASGRFDEARAAARRALAIEALLAQGRRIQLTPEQAGELRERLGAAEQDLRSAVGQGYTRVHVPTGLAEDGSVAFASRELATVLSAGRPLHERVREALETHVATKLFPTKVVALAGLDSEREWCSVTELADALPRYFDRPKVWTPDALRAGIAEAVVQGTLGYAAGAGVQGETVVVGSAEDVRLRTPLAPEAVSLESGAVLLRVTLAERLRTREPTPAAAEPTEAVQPPGSGTEPPTATMSGPDATGLELSIRATEDDLFVLNQSLTKLRQALDGGTMRLTVEVRAQGAAALDRLRVRNAVIEPLEEDPDVEVTFRWLDSDVAADGQD
jgi:hypothetical protein